MIFLYFRWNNSFHLDGLSKWAFPGSFALKTAVGGFFIYLYTYYYGDGILSEDAGVFMNESKILYDVFHESAMDYFKLLLGIDETGQLTQHYLSETSHWDTGNVGILSDNRFFIKLNSLIHFISFNQVGVHIIVLCAISTLALKQLYLIFIEHTILKKWFVFTALLLFPSLLFWSSGIAKEAVMILGLSLLARGLLSIVLSLHQKVYYIFFGSLLLLIFKAYVLVALIPSMLVYWLFLFLPKFKLIGSILVLIITITIGMTMFQNLSSNVIHLITRKQYDFNNVALGGIHAHLDSTFYYFSSEQLDALVIETDSIKIVKTVKAVAYKHGDISHPEDVTFNTNSPKLYIYFQNNKCNGYIKTTPIKNSPKQLILNIPEAFANSMFRPFPWDEAGKFKYLAILEMLGVFGILIVGIIKHKSLNKNESGLLLSIVVFVFVLSLFIGWVTPAIGAIVRYRLPAYLALLFVALFIFEPSKKYLKNE